jgi:hypothetical protein
VSSAAARGAAAAVASDADEPAADVSTAAVDAASPAAGAPAGAVTRLQDDDTGYRRWLAEHASGYVLNSERGACWQSEAPSGNVLVHQRHAARWTKLDGAVYQGLRAQRAGLGDLGSSDDRWIARPLPSVPAMSLPITPGTPERLPAPAPPDPDLDAAFARFLRLDVANGDASTDMIRGYRSQLAAWVNWCDRQAIDARTATVDDVKSYREDLVALGRQPGAIAHKLNVLRRVYAAAVAAGLRPDNPANRGPCAARSPRARGLRLPVGGRSAQASARSGAPRLAGTPGGARGGNHARQRHGPAAPRRELGAPSM